MNFVFFVCKMFTDLQLSINILQSLLDTKYSTSIPQIFVNNSQDIMLPSIKTPMMENQMADIFPLIFENNGGINNYALVETKTETAAVQQAQVQTHTIPMLPMVFNDNYSSGCSIASNLINNDTTELYDMLLQTLDVLPLFPLSFPLLTEQNIKMVIIKIGEEMAATIAQIKMEIEEDEKLMEQMHAQERNTMIIKSEKKITTDEVIKEESVAYKTNDKSTFKTDPVIQPQKWICTDCGKKFKHRTNLKIHAVKHTIFLVVCDLYIYLIILL